MPKKYPPEFKLDVVTVARRGGLSVPEVAAQRARATAGLGLAAALSLAQRRG